jgi:hypothetical protein
MRVLFAILILANAVFLSWMLLRAPHSEDAPAPPAASGNLVLLAERSDGAAPSLGQEPTTSSSCLATGPVRDAGALAALQATLSRANIVHTVIEHPHLAPLGFWVYIPPAETLDQAQETGRRLRRKSIDNFVYVVGAEKANAISLGLFATEREAAELAAHIRGLGFQPHIEQRYSRQFDRHVVIAAGVDIPAVAGVPPWRAVDCQHPEESLP